MKGYKQRDMQFMIAAVPRQQRNQSSTNAVEFHRQRMGDPSAAFAKLFVLPLRSLRPRCNRSISTVTLEIMNSAAKRLPVRYVHLICFFFSSPLLRYALGYLITVQLY